VGLGGGREEGARTSSRGLAVVTEPAAGASVPAITRSSEDLPARGKGDAGRHVTECVL
jgi:hypothetical protein